MTLYERLITKPGGVAAYADAYMRREIAAGNLPSERELWLTSGDNRRHAWRGLLRWLRRR